MFNLYELSDNGKTYAFRLVLERCTKATATSAAKQLSKFVIYHVTGAYHSSRF